MLNTSILVLEDDEDTAMIMNDFLESCGFKASLFSTVTDAISSIQYNSYDLILLDLNLPDYSGYEVLKFLNKNFITIPTIVISANSEKTYIIQAFKHGAIDFMKKPIDLEELEARIWVHLNKNTIFEAQKNNEIFKITEHEILFKQKSLDLTKIEFEIFSILIENKNNLISRENLAKQLSSKSNNRSLDYHIRNIRNKLEENGATKSYIVTEYGMGYKLII